MVFMSISVEIILEIWRKKYKDLISRKKYLLYKFQFDEKKHKYLISRTKYINCHLTGKIQRFDFTKKIIAIWRKKYKDLISRKKKLLGKYKYLAFFGISGIMFRLDDFIWQFGQDFNRQCWTSCSQMEKKNIVAIWRKKYTNLLISQKKITCS